jgi:general secretion pathway protein I
MFKRNLQCRQGFTLLEVMIAMAILAISLVAVYRSQSQSVSMAGEARFLTTASLLAQSKMAEMESLKPQELSDGSGGFGEDFPDYLWRVEVKDTAFQYLKKIDVIVTNSIMVANNAYHLELYRFVRK